MNDFENGCIGLMSEENKRLQIEWWCNICGNHDGVGCIADNDCKAPYQEVSVIIPPSEYKKK